MFHSYKLQLATGHVSGPERERQKSCSAHRRSMQGVHVHRAEKIFSGPNLQGKVVSAPPGRECTPPPRQSRVHFFRKLGRCERGRGYLGNSSVCFGESDDLREEKCTPDKILVTPMARRSNYSCNPHSPLKATASLHRFFCNSRSPLRSPFVGSLRSENKFQNIQN